MTIHLGVVGNQADVPLQAGGDRFHSLDEQNKVSPESTLKRWAIFGILLAALLTGIMSFLTWQSTRQGEDDADWVVHSLAVEKVLQVAVGHAAEAATQARGFAVTGQETILNPYKNQQEALAQDLDTLRQLTADNASQQRHLDLLGSQVNTSMQSDRRLHDEIQRNGAIPSKAELIEDKRRMDEVQATVAEMQGEETKLFSQRMDSTQKARRQTRIVVVSSALLGMALLVLAGLILLREIDRSARMRGQVKTLNSDLLQLATDLESRVVERTQQLETTVVELRHKNEEVEAFVYIVSHDLRAPLVNLMGFARELDGSCARLKALLEPCALPESCSAGVFEILDADMPSSVHFISQSSLKFERLIDALLSLSRYGREIYRVAQVDVEEVVTNAVANFHKAITEGGATVEVGRLPSAKADFTALGQVFANLIGNSLKYRSPQRPLKVEVGGANEDGAVHYWVRDNGLGIPEAGKSRLFQVFQRFHPQQAEGEGMGLAIAHRIVERHGGRIWAESQQGEGTTFHFSIPNNSEPGLLSSALDANQRGN